MSFNKINCPKCGQLISIRLQSGKPAELGKPANDNRPPAVVVRTFEQLRDGAIYLEIALGYVAMGVSRRTLLDVASTRVSEFLYAEGLYRIASIRADGSVSHKPFNIGPDCLDRVFRPDSTGDIRWLGRLEARVESGETFRAPRPEILEKLQYLDLVIRTPLCGLARR